MRTSKYTNQNLVTGGGLNKLAIFAPRLRIAISVLQSVGMAFLLSFFLASCGKDQPAQPAFQGDQLYQQMLGTHRWVSDYDPTYRYWVGTWAESYVRFTADSVVFYHLVQCSDWMTDSVWYETRTDAAHAYTFSVPDRYTFGGIQYLVQPSQLHPTCYTFWGDDQSGFEVDVERIEVKI